MKITSNGIEICCQACGENDIAVEQLGGDAALSQAYTVMCRKCGHIGPVCETRADAIAAWSNENRAAERKLIARIGELDAALAAEKAAHQKLRAGCDAARAILADIDVREDDCAYTTASIGRAFQVLDTALDAEAGQAVGEEGPKC